MKPNSRREFFKLGMGAVLGLVLADRFARAQTAQLPNKNPVDVDPKGPIAGALHYHPDARKVDPKAFPKRSGAEGKKQFCRNCNFYTPYKGSKGECQLMQNNLVNAGGWCTGWAQKAGVK